MTENEKELIELIRNSEDPSKALEIAIGVITAFLERQESCQLPSACCPPELV